MIMMLMPAVAGCVERRVTITTEPPGAMVYFADEEIGRTPLTVPFTWYGDRELIIRREGHETLRRHMVLRAPWYDIPPWDLVSQAFVPWTYRHHVERRYELEPLTIPPSETLIERAVELRGDLPPTPQSQ
ncbi:MAG: PEGA domain-containing protein [Planctomycetota bacterium]